MAAAGATHVPRTRSVASPRRALRAADAQAQRAVRICNSVSRHRYQPPRTCVVPGTSLAAACRPDVVASILRPVVARRGRRARSLVPELPHRWHSDGSGPSPRELSRRVFPPLRPCYPSRPLRQVGARHRLQRRLLLVRDEAPRRGARRRHRLETRYLRRRASPPRSIGARHRVPPGSVYDVGDARRTFRSRALHGRALSPAPSAARARPAVGARGAATRWCSSRMHARQHARCAEWRPTIPSPIATIFDDPA